MKKIAILGSTGSIGTQTLSVIEEHADDFEVTALACGNNIRLLEEQMRKFRPKLVAVWSKEAAASLRVARRIWAFLWKPEWMDYLRLQLMKSRKFW